MTDQELADRVVALGGGEKIDTWFDVPVDNRYAPPANASSVCVAFEFIRDWRVAGVLMDKWAQAFPYDDVPWSEWKPHEIILACVEVLEET